MAEGADLRRLMLHRRVWRELGNVVRVEIGRGAVATAGPTVSRSQRYRARYGPDNCGSAIRRVDTPRTHHHGRPACRRNRPAHVRVALSGLMCLAKRAGTAFTDGSPGRRDSGIVGLVLETEQFRPVVKAPIRDDGPATTPLAATAKPQAASSSSRRASHRRHRHQGGSDSAARSPHRGACALLARAF